LHWEVEMRFSIDWDESTSDSETVQRITGMFSQYFGGRLEEASLTERLASLGEEDSDVEDEGTEPVVEEVVRPAACTGGDARDAYSLNASSNPSTPASSLSGQTLLL
jgi:hypothetical protein